MSAKKLSKGEKKIVSAWNGSIKETAEKIKMSYAYVQKVVKKDYIITLLQEREEKDATPLIADRQERQEFWTSVLRGDPQVVKMVEKTDADGKAVLGEDGKPVMVKVMGLPSMKERQRASELLGRSSADFVDRLHVLDENKGVPQEITDDMEPKQATNAYLDLVKNRTAGNA